MKSRKIGVASLICAGLALVALAFTFSPSSEASDGILAIGKKAPEMDLKMKDVSGEEVSLSTVAGENGLLVIFSCNTCPFVIGNGKKSEGWEGRYPNIYNLAHQAGVGMVLVNSNAAKRNSGDGFQDMKAHYKTEGYKGYYVLDKDHKLADAFGALTTPHVFLFDENMQLVYKGAIDDSVDSSREVKQPYLKNAMLGMLAGSKIKPNSTRQLGCSIKRVKKE